MARVGDLPAVLPTLLGKVEFEMGEEGRERDVLEHLLRMAIATTFRERLGGLDLSGFTTVFAEGAVVETGDLVPAADLLSQLGTVPGLAKVLDRLGYADDGQSRRGRGRRRVRPRGPAPDPPDRQGRRRRPHRLRRPVTCAMSAERYEGGDPHGRFRYGPWRGGPDPLAPPYDVRAALDEIGEDVLSGGTVRDALRELMRRGLDGRGGLDELAQRLRKLRAAARKRGDLGGTLDQIRAALDQALAAEREQLAGMDGDEPGWPRWSWTPSPTTWPAPSGR